MRKTKPVLSKNSMPWKTSKSLLTQLLIMGRRGLPLLLASMLLTGCAGKPWKEPLQGPAVDSVSRQVDALVARDAACGGTLEGDLVLFYQNPIERRALSGYLQFSMPSSYKFVMTNPFGQPILAIAGDQKSFQVINTLQRKYLAGSLRSFALRHDIPDYFLKNSWGPWLTGRNQLSSQAITDIRTDRDARGVWLTLKDEDQTGVSHLLLDRDKEVYLSRVLENAEGRTVAEITYGKWATLGQCRQPQEIRIAGLDYGTDVLIQLSNVSLSDEKKTFRLQVPTGFMQQYMP
jgi:outer membrane biogenesis lipoprotein LolB